ncbi:MAG: hypothetical protein QOG63_2283 [Thermoleophilaceae bacterium]|jgi:hypothetical protein|nr:hypothetical protein [Thermoleophilaceae bacterium]
MADKVTTVASVDTFETRSGKTRWVLRDSDGAEYTTFRPKIGQTAAAFEGRRARIEFHEEERNGFQNVYLDGIAAADQGGGPVTGGEREEHADEVAWKAAIDAAPWLLGTDKPKQEVPPDELYEKLRPFKERVSDDIEQGEGETS